MNRRSRGGRLICLTARGPARAVFLAALLLLSIQRAAPALAHANLVRSDPAAGAILKESPAQIQLWFSEQPDPHFSDVRVQDTQRQRVDSADMHVVAGDAQSLVVGVKPALPNGLYTVSWKTVSAVDGHVVNGSFPFYVGQPPQGIALSTGVQQGPSSTSSGDLPVPGTVVIRWLSLLGAVLLLGGFAIWPVVLLPSLASSVGTPIDTERRAAIISALTTRSGRLLTVAWLLLCITAVAVLLLQAKTVSDVPLRQVFGQPLGTLLFRTRFGHVWWIRSAATAALGLLLLGLGGRARGRRMRRMSVVGILGVEVVLLSFSLNSHAAALTSGALLATISDLVHLTVAGLWIGGLVQLALLTPSALKILDAAGRVRFLALAVPRFSRLATVCVALLALTGVYQAYRQLPGRQALWQSGWGLTLDLKLLLLVPLLLLGAMNLLIARPAFARAALNGVHANQAGASSLKRLERRFIKTVVSESLIGVAILLVVGVLVNQPPPRAIAVGGTGAHLVAKAEGVTVTLDITPARLGLNHFEAAVNQRGKPPVDGTQLVFRLTYQDSDMGTSELQTVAAGRGRFSADTSDLSTFGHWQILALVQPPTADEVRTEFSLKLTDAGTNGASAQAQGDTSVKKGQQLYAQNCAVCHGDSAHGDGPQAKLLDPPPVDLIVHVPQHTDLQLLDWITNGIPTTAMPAFGQKLNPGDRQAILNYLRNLTRDATPRPATPTATP